MTAGSGKRDVLGKEKGPGADLIEYRPLVSPFANCWVVNVKDSRCDGERSIARERAWSKEKDGWQILPMTIGWQRKETIVPTRNINLTEHLDHFVERQVASGRYSNASEIVREALRLLEEQEQERKAKLKALRLAARRGFDEIDQGKGAVLKGKKAIDRFIADIATEVRTKAAQNGGQENGSRRRSEGAK